MEVKCLLDIITLWGGVGEGNNLSVLEMIRLPAKAFDFGSWILGDSFSSTPY